jgi:hypothetical protein
LLYPLKLLLDLWKVPNEIFCDVVIGGRRQQQARHSPEPWRKPTRFLERSQVMRDPPIMGSEVVAPV